jgi:imidazolonepropionase-like amidohydrolase
MSSFSIAQMPIAIVGGTLIDGTGSAPVGNSVIVIQGTKIIAVGTKQNVSIPNGAQVIEAKGKYIIPGLIDCHVHYEQPRDLVQMLAWGVTSVNCMFESTDQALAMEKMTSSDTMHSPQVYATAPIFTCEGGWWHGEGFAIDSTVNRFPKTPDEAREAVRRVKAKGIKRIKLMYDDMGWCRDPLPKLQQMTPEIMAALLQEAVNQDLFAEIHVPQLKDLRDVFGVRARYIEGVEGGAIYYASFACAHGVIDDTLPGSYPWEVISYVPTFCVFEFLADTRRFMKDALGDQRFQNGLSEDVVQHYLSEEYFDRYKQRYPNISFVKSHLAILQTNMRKLFNAKVNISMGTDMWAFPGIGAHLELEYMVDAGLSAAQTIVISTRNGARFLRSSKSLGLNDEDYVGIIQKDRQADLLILDANPLDDIRNTRSVRTIIKHGKIFDHQQLIEESKQMK